jgi:iron(III) transport system substrate-binding protein
MKPAKVGTTLCDFQFFGRKTMSINRRTFVATGIAASVLAPQMGMSQDTMDALYEAAKAEGEITWYVVPLSSDSAEIMGQKFTELFPGIKVNVVRSTATVAFQRLNQDIDSGVANCDVLTTSNMAHALDLKSRKLLMAYDPIRKSEVIADFQGLDADNMFHVTTAGPMCIVYNTDKVSNADAPKSWTDLLDPKWKKKVAIGHPGFSGYVGIWSIKMQELYGYDYFDKLVAQEPYVGRSSIDVVTTTVSGETSVGAGPAASSLSASSKGNPIANIYPEDGTVIITSPSCILGNAPHPNAAKLFSEFLLGVEFNEEIAKQFGTPIRAGIELQPGVQSLADIKVITANPDQIVNEIPVLVEKFRDTFGI